MFCYYVSAFCPLSILPFSLLPSSFSSQEGEVYCYVDDEKPPIGQGLNTDAEITLLNVYKLDAATKQPLRCVMCVWCGVV